MKLKPVKCRTFSIKSGSPADLNFSIGDKKIPTIFHEEQKFLGKVLFPLGKSSDTFKLVKTELFNKLENLDKTLIRKEYKLWIYQNYLIPSIRFIMTIHDLTKSDLNKLDVFTDKYVKMWSSLPPSATNAVIHMQTGMNIPTISHLHRLSHCLAHSRTRILGDEKVNHALTIKLGRESMWTNKHSSTCNAEEIFQAAIQTEPLHPLQKAKQTKEKIKLIISTEKEASLLAHVKTLVKQGHFLLLASVERSDMLWKSYMYDMKKGTLKFLMNSCLDTLPTQANLKQWGKTTSDLCKVCLRADPPLQGSRRETLQHVLNSCKVSLNLGKFTWRHDNIVRYICQSIDLSKCTLYADITPFSLAGGGTMPPHIMVTSYRPDIVIISDKQMFIFELTVPLEPNIQAANLRKTEKYSHMVTDISDMKVNLIPFEIGSRGYISPENKKNLRTLHKFCLPSTHFSTFTKNLSTLAVLSSYYIFINRKTADWDTDTPALKPLY